MSTRNNPTFALSSHPLLTPHTTSPFSPSYVNFLGKNDMFSAISFNVSVSNWKNDIGYASGGNPYQFGEPGYYSFLNSGSNVSASDPSNGDTQAMLDAVAFLKSKYAFGS